MTGNSADFTPEQLLVEAIKGWVGAKFIGDDCALLPGGRLVSSDTLVEGTHFILGKIAWEDLGWKAVSVNLSDIAAMAGRPRHLVVNLTLPDYVGLNEVKRLYAGISECARQYRCEIVGGDLTSGPNLVITVTVIGDVHEQGCLMRKGARVGDLIAVTGDFGASAAGLWLLLNEETPDPACRSLRQHVHPLPRLCESWALLGNVKGRAALMDASDGLADAVVQIARASNVGAVLNFDTLPVDSETREIARIAGVDPIDWALYGGEDYELVATLPEEVWNNWHEDNPFRIVGRIIEGSGVFLAPGDADLRISSPAQVAAMRRLDLSHCFKQIKL